MVRVMVRVKVRVKVMVRVMNYYEWSARGNYNSDKAHAAWDYAAKQIIKVYENRLKAKDRYIAAYKIGGKMPEWVFDTLDRTEKQIEKIKKEHGVNT